MKATFQIEDQANQPRPPLSIDVEVEEQCGLIWMKIKPKGYGDNASADGCGVPIALEMVDGRLRLLVWPDINSDNPLVIDMEGAREDARKPPKRIVHAKSLPFFKDDGTVSIWVEGKEEIVPLARFKDITSEGGRAIQFYTFEITE